MHVISNEIIHTIHLKHFTKERTSGREREGEMREGGGRVEGSERKI